MQITNKAGLPRPVFDLIANDEYTTGGADVSVTKLIDSPRVRVLYKRHDAEMSIDGESLLAAALGKAFHKAVELATRSGEAENRYFAEVLGWKLSGGIDHHEGGVITDYKTLNVFKCVYSSDGSIPEFEKQLNVYAFLLRENGHTVNGLRIFGLFKDWNRRDAKRAQAKGGYWRPWLSAGYPEKAWSYFDVPLWSPGKARAYVEERVRLHQEAEVQLPRCSSEETWDGRRCLEYCNASRWCEQFNQKGEK